MRHSGRGGAFFLGSAWLLGVCLVSVACKKEEGPKTDGVPSSSASAVPLGLTSELGARVLAKVGDRTITLADYAAVLDGMDRFERIRYQTLDRRKQLLDEMIQVELLAREAERRGLAEKPEAKEMVRQILRDAVLEDLRSQQPKPEELPRDEVRTFYDAHHAEFREPERRRISVIVFTDAASAAKALPLAVAASPREWGELVTKYGTVPKDMPPELAGDLGFVKAPAEGANDNAKVPETVRTAAFEAKEAGTMVSRVVADGKSHYLVRVVAVNAPRDRSFEEAERVIRVRLLQDRFEQARAALEKKLAEKYPVKIDEAALAKVSAPPSSGPP